MYTLVHQLKKGMDKSENHVDTKVVLMDESVKITIHLFNSTQRLTVAGKGFSLFTCKVLEPYITSKIDALKSDIMKYDKAVIDAFGSKSVRRSDVKFTAVPDTVSIISCNQCDFSSKQKYNL